MSNHRQTAIVVGVLFIIATAASIAAGVTTAPLLEGETYLGAIAGGASTMVVGVLLMLLASASIAGIPIMMFPILDKHNETAALWFLVARLFEAVFYVVGCVGMLTLVVLANEHAGSAAPDAAYYGTLGTVIRGVQDIAFNLGTVVFFSLSAIILGVVLYQTRLVPRWLGVWTVIGGILLEIEGVLVMFGASTPLLDATLFIPIAVAEMVFAVWLIAKGFDEAALSRLTAKAIHP